MSRRRAGTTRFATLILALLALLGPGAGVADAKKKKGGGGGTVDITNSTPLAIPDRAPGANGLIGVARSTINVGGKQFKGQRIRDVNVTVQLTGTGTSPLGEIAAFLKAPNGATTFLFSGLVGTFAGPLTLDDESVNGFGALPGTQSQPQILFAPYQGTARPGLGFFPPLQTMANGPVTGTWTLLLTDSTNGETTVLNSWRLLVAAGPPFRTK